MTAVIAGPVAAHNVALTASGAAYVWGRNETAQLGLGNTVNRYQPVELVLSSQSPVIGGACGAVQAGAGEPNLSLCAASFPA